MRPMMATSSGQPDRDDAQELGSNTFRREALVVSSIVITCRAGGVSLW